MSEKKTRPLLIRFIDSPLPSIIIGSLFVAFFVNIHASIFEDSSKKYEYELRQHNETIEASAPDPVEHRIECIYQNSYGTWTARRLDVDGKRVIHDAFRERYMGDLPVEIFVDSDRGHPWYEKVASVITGLDDRKQIRYKVTVHLTSLDEIRD